VPFLPTLEMVAWFAGLFFVSYQLQKAFHSRFEPLSAIIPALTIVFFTLYLTPAQYQILFWLSAMQTYLTPLVLATFLFGCLVAVARSSKFRVIPAIGLGLLAFFAGGLSETTGLWQFACWSLVLGWGVLFRKRSSLARNIIRPALIMIGCVAVSLVIMASSPANFNTGAVFYHPTLITLILQSFSYGAGFLWLALKGTPLPYAVILLTGFFAGIGHSPKEAAKVRNLLVEILVVIAVLYALSVVTVLPSMYANSHYPGDRALLPAQFSLSVCLFIIGWKMAQVGLAWLPKAFSFRTLIVLQSLLGLLLCAYMVRTTARVYDRLPAYQGRAEAWDQRQALILQQKAAGIENVTAPAFEAVYGITELKYEPENWVNECAAYYYGVKTITTVEDYAGISAHPIGR